MSNVTSAREETQSPVAQVKEQVQDAAAQAKGQTLEQVRGQIDSRSTQVGEQLSSTAQAVRRAGVQLREEGKEGPAKIVEGLAERGERLGSYLSRADGNQLLGDVEGLGRKQPWLFVGGSAVVGFLAARFLKASSRSRYQSYGAVSKSDGDVSGDSGRSGSPAATLPPPTPTPAVRPTETHRPRASRGSAAAGGVSGGLD
jgi:ElaB/YqjD/DUF883 family membrane-anchored ribosome-binding protein